jgi:hypothetical protein
VRSGSASRLGWPSSGAAAPEGDGVAVEPAGTDPAPARSKDPRRAAPAALVSGYDPGAWNDSVSKLQLLVDLGRIRGRLHTGQDVFGPERDRRAFGEHCCAIKCQSDISAVGLPTVEPTVKPTRSGLRLERW